MPFDLSPAHSDCDVRADSSVRGLSRVYSLKLPLLLKTLGSSVGKGNPF